MADFVKRVKAGLNSEVDFKRVRICILAREYDNFVGLVTASATGLSFPLIAKTYVQAHREC